MMRPMKAQKNWTDSGNSHGPLSVGGVWIETPDGLVSKEYPTKTTAD
jgi:hypothetical protein